ARPRHRPADPVRKGPAPVTHAPETTVPAPTPLDREGLRGRIDAALGDLLDRGLDGLGFLDEELEPVAAALRAFVLAGGKRLRPAFVYWGYRGAGGGPGSSGGPVGGGGGARE